MWLKMASGRRTSGMDAYTACFVSNANKLCVLNKLAMEVDASNLHKCRGGITARRPNSLTRCNTLTSLNIEGRLACSGPLPGIGS